MTDEYLSAIKKVSDAWRGTDTYGTAAQLIDDLVAEVAILRAQQEQKPYEFAPIAQYDGLKRKYVVLKADTGECVEHCFVLRPDRDAAAVAALRAYAGATDNQTLAIDIINWVGTEYNAPLTLDELLQMDGETIWLQIAGGVLGLVDTADSAVWLDRCGSVDFAKLVGLAYRHKPEEGTT